jgi:hypothetical protein
MKRKEITKKVGLKLKDKPLNEEHKNNISKALKGKPTKKPNDEARLKMREQKLGSKSPTAKLVFNIKTNIFYDTILEAAEFHNIPYDNLKYWLKVNSKKNKTGLILV